jgi:hypothetical protein
VTVTGLLSVDILSPSKFYLNVSSQNFVMSPRGIYQATAKNFVGTRPITDVEDMFIRNVILEHEMGDVTVVIP